MYLHLLTYMFLSAVGLKLILHKLLIHIENEKMIFYTSHILISLQPIVLECILTPRSAENIFLPLFRILQGPLG